MVMPVIRWLFETNLYFGTKSIPLREVLGGVLGITSAFLGMKRKVAAWPVGIFADAMLFTVFLGAVFTYSENDANFYGQASRNLLLIVVSVYGWVQWAQHRRNGDGVSPAVSPRWTTKGEKIVLVPVIIIFYIVSMQIFKALGESGSWLLVDTWIFTGTALATFGMSRGYIEFWLVWIAVDLVGVPFAFSNGYYPTGTLYAFYLPLVIWGFFSWLKIYRSERVGRS